MATSPEQPQSQALAQMSAHLTAQLAALGGETRAQRRVKSILPWVLSVAIHLGLLGVAIFITWTVANLPKHDEAVLIVADFNALRYEPVVSLPLDAVPQSQTSALTPLDTAPPAPAADQILHQLRQADADPLAALVDLGHSGEVAASALANLAPRSDPTAASFAGTSATNARHIVYLIDATGSMVAHLGTVVKELEKSLVNLSPQQRFAVILFQDDKVLSPGLRLVPATSAERARVLKWIEESVAAKGRTDPVPAITAALRLKPDVIFLLSHGLTGHGEFELNQAELLAKIDQLNPIQRTTGQRATMIKCIQYIQPDALDTMRRIAEAHGGADGYKFLSAQEVGLRSGE